MIRQIDAIHEPEIFARMFLKILDKEKNLVSLRWNKAQQHFHQHRTGRDLVLKARQLGFSTYVQAEMYHRTVTSTRTTMTMAHDSETTQKLRRMADRFWENCKFGDTQPERKYSNASLATYPEFDSTSVIATAGSKEAGRGDTYTDFHGSEVAFWNDAEKIMAGAMQGGSPDIILESTPNGAQGYFYDLCMDALGGNSPWTLHFYPWWWDENYSLPLAEGETVIFTGDEEDLSRKHGLTAEQIKWRRSKQRELKNLFIQEYPEDPINCFITSGNSYFGDVTHVFTEQIQPYYNDHKYYAGLDFGQNNDFTAMKVFDFTTKREVNQLRVNNLSWAEIRKRIVSLYKQYNLQLLLAEKNSIGSVNIEALQSDGLTVIPFETTNASKAEIMSNLHEAINEGGWRMLDDPITRQEFKLFVATQTTTGLWRLAAEGNGHDDTVISAALSLEAGSIKPKGRINITTGNYITGNKTEKRPWTTQD